MSYVLITRTAYTLTNSSCIKPDIILAEHFFFFFEKTRTTHSLSDINEGCGTLSVGGHSGSAALDEFSVPLLRSNSFDPVDVFTISGDTCGLVYCNCVLDKCSPHCLLRADLKIASLEHLGRFANRFYDGVRFFPLQTLFRARRKTFRSLQVYRTLFPVSNGSIFSTLRASKIRIWSGKILVVDDKKWEICGVRFSLLTMQSS